MNRYLSCFGFCLIVFVSISFAQERVIPVYGNFHGEFTSDEWKDYSIRAEIIGESGSTYKAILIINGNDMDEMRVNVPGKTEKNSAKFAGNVNLGNDLGVEYTASGTVNKGVFTGSLSGKKGEGKFELKWVQLKSPTLGKYAPEGAIPLMWDGMSQDELNARWEVRPHWEVKPNGFVQITHTNIVTKQAFQDAEYHIEFRTPYMPNDRGQGRGNSGVYLHGKYEVQVLDSFGLPAKDNECGGIYRYAVPLMNACLPPMETQTYDITFHAARYDSSGTKTRNAVVHIIHNGHVIHDQLELKSRSGGGLGGMEAAEGPLLLQDHNNIVGYKNIWVKPL